MIAILHKQLKLRGTLQLLSVHTFEKTPLHQLLTEPDSRNSEAENHKQLMLYGL